MEFIATVDTYAEDHLVRTIWGQIRERVKDRDGICYYKHPVLMGSFGALPDLTMLAKDYEPLVVKCIQWELDEIDAVDNESWVVKGNPIDSPFLELEDYIYGLINKFNKERDIRSKFSPLGAIVFPLIAESNFRSKFKELHYSDDIRIIWADLNIDNILEECSEVFEKDEWNLAKSIFQGASPLNKKTIIRKGYSNKLGESIKILGKNIALLDVEQHKVSVQMAPGPQRIRGLAGTGKTVILAMKAANIHSRYPEKKILFTFNTQSLYNQTKSLISKFYRVNSDKDPDWDYLHVRHAWGSKYRPGVYSDLSKRLGIETMILSQAKRLNYNNPFQACCNRLLEEKISPFYDFILVDEAQDFPGEYFKVLARLITEEKRIYWAYDELQSLSAVEVPQAEELFGSDENGAPFITLDGEYPGGIEKDFVLHRSYRCPMEILALAHGIGLGIHGPRGCVQMLGNKISWEAIGYEIKSGKFIEGHRVVISRPEQNSPNPIKQMYRGEQEIVQVKVFKDRDKEIDWVVDSIENDVKVEGVKPEDIVVISLDSKNAKGYLKDIQHSLFEKEINSTIPGLVDQSWEFAEPDMVTLSTVYRAKGNEAPIVYIISFDYLYSYAEEIENRNRAFASISRSKGWVRITGSGPKMKDIKEEIEKILEDLPLFDFTFPNLDNIRKLDDSETSRRRKVVKKARKSVSELVSLEKDALTDIDPLLLKKLKNLLQEVEDED